jgi:transposase
MAERGDRFELRRRELGALPIVGSFFGRIGLDAVLERHLRADDRRLRLAPAKVIGLVITNLLVSHEPAYAMSEWARRHEPGLLGLSASEIEALNDDRIGRSLERLFDADRASLLTEVVLNAVRAFGVDCTQLHNDSTSITFSGDYRHARGQRRGGKPTAVITHGFNKDHRPDLKQLVFILTVSADGAVPIAHRVAAGNTEDSGTHVATWDELVALLGRSDFLYVADCKLATREAMEHIASHQGRFVTVLPRSRREDGWFRSFIAQREVAWSEVRREPPRRKGEPEDVLSVFESPLPSAEGFRIVWVRSSAKRDHDAATRARHLVRATAALEELAGRLCGPRRRMTTRAAVEEAAHAILAEHEVSRYLELSVAETREKTYRAEHRGRPGPGTRFRQEQKPRFRLTWRVLNHVVRDVAASDGCFPLVTNDASLDAGEVLAAYKFQPNLERRNHLLKGQQTVAPVNLHSPARIEALLCCHFIALLVAALIEREIRQAMSRSGTRTVPLYPENRDCAAPSAERVLEIFAGLARHHLCERGSLVQSFEPALDERQQQVLRLLGIEARAYRLGRGRS